MYSAHVYFNLISFVFIHLHKHNQTVKNASSCYIWIKIGDRLKERESCMRLSATTQTKKMKKFLLFGRLNKLNTFKILDATTSVV